MSLFSLEKNLAVGGEKDNVKWFWWNIGSVCRLIAELLCCFVVRVYPGWICWCNHHERETPYFTEHTHNYSTTATYLVVSPVVEEERHYIT